MSIPEQSVSITVDEAGQVLEMQQIASPISDQNIIQQGVFQSPLQQRKSSQLQLMQRQQLEAQQRLMKVIQGQQIDQEATGGGAILDTDQLSAHLAQLMSSHETLKEATISAMEDTFESPMMIQTMDYAAINSDSQGQVFSPVNSNNIQQQETFIKEQKQDEADDSESESAKSIEEGRWKSNAFTKEDSMVDVEDVDLVNPNAIYFKNSRSIPVNNDYRSQMSQAINARFQPKRQESSSIDQTSSFKVSGPQRMQHQSSNTFLENNDHSTSIQKTISGALAATLPEAKQRDILLQNVMKLEQLIRNTSREQNPRPNYSRILRPETETEQFEREKNENELQMDDDKAEKDIIAHDVDQMIYKINRDRKAPERVLFNENFAKPNKYFESKGAKKAQMRTQTKSLVTRQRFSTTTNQINNLLDEFSSIKKHNRHRSLVRKGSKNRADLVSTVDGVFSSRKVSAAASGARSTNAPSALHNLSVANLQESINQNEYATKTSNYNKNTNNTFSSQRQSFSFHRKPSRSNNQSRLKSASLTNRKSQPAQFFSTSPKNQDLPFKQFRRSSRVINNNHLQNQSSAISPFSNRKLQNSITSNHHLHQQYQNNNNNSSILTQKVNTLFGTINPTDYDDQTTVIAARLKNALQNPQTSSTTAKPEDSKNINVNINFNVQGNLNFVTPGADNNNISGEATMILKSQKSSLRRPQSGVQRNVEFDPRFLKQKNESPIREMGAKPRSSRPMSAAIDRKTIFKNPQFTRGVQAQPISEMENADSIMKDSHATLDVLTKQSNLSKSGATRDGLGTFLTQGAEPQQVQQKKPNFICKPAESSYGMNNSQTVMLKNFFENTLQQLTQNMLDDDYQDDESKLKSTQKSIKKQTKLFDQIYMGHKHINAQKTTVDKALKIKEPTLASDIIETLFNAKFADLQLPNTHDQLQRFTEHCNDRNVNGLLYLTDMKLSFKFSNALDDVLFRNPDNLRITHLHLERNLLRDAGALKIAQAVVDSQCLVYLNLASNEIKPSGINQIIETLIPNQSLSELRLGSEKDGTLNRVNGTIESSLQRLVTENNSMICLSFCGTGLTFACLKGVFEKLREAQCAKQKQIDDLEEQKTKEFRDFEHKYWRDDGQNMPLQLLMKTRRRFRQPVELGEIRKLAIQSLDLSHNDITLVSNVQELFCQAIAYSQIIRLDLSYNALGNEGIGVIAKALMYRSQLKYLNVASCGFDLEGAHQFIGQLGKNHTIEHVVIDNNNLFGRLHRQKVLKDMFFYNKTLKVISLSNCNLTQSGAANISRGLGFSSTLVSLNLSNNNFGDQGVDWLMDSFFLESVCIKHLYLSDNGFSDKAGTKLARAFCANRSLSSVDLRYNNLSEKTGILLKPACKMNARLIKIQLEFNVCRIKVIEELNELTKANIKRLEQRKHRDIKNQAKELRQGGIRQVSFEKVSKEQQMQEIDDQMQGFSGIVEQYTEQNAELESKLLSLQENPDPKLQKLREINRILRVEQIEMLKNVEDSLQREIENSKKTFDQETKSLKSRTEEAGQYVETHKYGATVQEKKLRKRLKDNDAERQTWLQQLTAVEQNLENKMLKHKLALRDIEKEQASQDKQVQFAKEAEEKRIALERKLNREEESKKKPSRKQSKAGTKRKASSSSVKKKAKSKKSK